MFLWFFLIDFMLIKKRNKMVKTKMKSKEQAVNQERCNSEGLDRKRLGLSFDPVKRLDQRCMRGCTLGVFDLDMSSFDLEVLGPVRS